MLATQRKRYSNTTQAKQNVSQGSVSLLTAHLQPVA